MGTNIPFFQRGTLVGGTGTTYDSEPFDASQLDSLTVRLKVDAVIGTSPSIDAMIRTAPNLEGDWWDAAVFTQFSSATTETESLSASDMSQFVRARIIFTAGSDMAATLSILGIGREIAG
jgi:hypothetical protein